MIIILIVIITQIIMTSRAPSPASAPRSVYDNDIYNDNIDTYNNNNDDNSCSYYY